MRMIMLALTLGLGLSVMGQSEITTAFKTTSTESSMMSWNASSGEWDFEDNDDLTSFESMWYFHLGEDGKGGYFKSGEEFIYSVFDWRHIEGGVFVNFYSHKRNEEGTLIIVVREDNRNSLSFFLPDSYLSISFHQKVD